MPTEFLKTKQEDDIKQKQDDVTQRKNIDQKEKQTFGSAPRQRQEKEIKIKANKLRLFLLTRCRIS